MRLGPPGKTCHVCNPPPAPSREGPSSSYPVLMRTQVLEPAASVQISALSLTLRVMCAVTHASEAWACPSVKQR